MRHTDSEDTQYDVMTERGLSELITANMAYIGNDGRKTFNISSHWMQTALSYFGVSEASGRRSNPQIIQFIWTTQQSHRRHPATYIGTVGRRRHTSTVEIDSPNSISIRNSRGLSFNQHEQTIDDSDAHEYPWCSAFVNHVMIRSGYCGTRSLSARSWLDWTQGQRISSFRFGAIAVFERVIDDGRRSGRRRMGGHVGFILGEDSDSYLVYGGNQHNHVCVERRPKTTESPLLAYIWPT